VRAVRAAILAASALALGGCTYLAPVTSFLGMGDDSRKPAALTPITAKVTPKAAWTAAVGKPADFVFHPEVLGGKVYAANADGDITILDEATGRVLAKVETKKRFAGGLAVAENLVIAGTLKGDVLAYDLAGKALWTTNVLGEVIAPAAITKKTVVVRTSDGRIFGLDAADGKRRWVYQRQAPALLLRTDASVHVTGNDVVAGYAGGKLIALDLEDGKLTWEVTVTAPRGATELERISDVAGIPIVEPGRICAGAFQGKIACFEIQTRNMLWSRDVSTPSALAVDATNLYAVDDNSHVHALDKASGTSVWKNDKLAFRRVTAPVIAGGNVVLGDYQGQLHVLAPATGEIVGRLATDGTRIRSIRPGTSGLLVQTAGGSVVMVRF